MDLSSLGRDAEKHRKLIKWATERGVLIDGVAPAKLPNKGLGVVATRRIEKHEVFIHVPRDATLRIDPDRKVFPAGFEESSVHGRVARRLIAKTLDGSREFAAWIDAMPSLESLKAEMPCLWDRSLHKLLPDEAKDLLDSQMRKMNTDLERITDAELRSQASSDVELQQLREEYTHAWLLVNTRCFYWDYPDLETRKSLPKTKRARLQLDQKKKQRHRDDCMALNPFVDYFNHSTNDESVTVAFNIDGFQVHALRDIEPGEELLVSYGKYSNDFLLVEYGFMFEGNEEDSVRMDTWLLPLLPAAQQELLDQLGFLGDCTVSLRDLEVCYRTQTAMRSLVVSSTELEAHVHGIEHLRDENPRRKRGKGDMAPSEVEIQQEINTKIKELLHRVIKDARDRVITLKDDVGASQEKAHGIATLVVRWEEILSIVRRTLGRLA